MVGGRGGEEVGKVRRELGPSASHGCEAKHISSRSQRKLPLPLDAPDGAGEAGAELADRAQALEIDLPDGVAALGELERLGHRLHLGLVTHYGCTQRGQGSRHVVTWS